MVECSTLDRNERAGVHDSDDRISAALSRSSTEVIITRPAGIGKQ